MRAILHDIKLRINKISILEGGDDLEVINEEAEEDEEAKENYFDNLTKKLNSG